MTHTKSKPTIIAPVNLVTAENDLSDAPKAADAPGAINATTNAARASRTRGEPGCEKAMIKVPMQDATIAPPMRSEEHTSELQSLMRISYAVFCFNKNNTQ